MNSINKQNFRNIHLMWILVILISIAAGILSVFVNLILIIIPFIVIINVLLIFRYPMWGLLSYLIVFLLRPAELYPDLAALRPELSVGIITMLAVIMHQKIELGKSTHTIG